MGLKGTWWINHGSNSSVIKSDQNGIESVHEKTRNLFKEWDKIRPKWD